MRIITIILLLILLATNLNGQLLPDFPAEQPVRYDVPYGLVGLVKTVTVSSKNYNTDSVDQKVARVRHFEFSKGKVLRNVRVIATGSRDQKSTIAIQFDQHGRRTVLESFSGDTLYRSITYLYRDRERKSIAMEFAGGPRLADSTVIEYDQYNNPLKKSNFGASGKLMSFVTYEYDGHHNQTRQIYRNAPDGYGLEAFGTFTPWPNDTVTTAYQYIDNRITSRDVYRKGVLSYSESHYSDGDTTITKKIEYGKVGIRKETLLKKRGSEEFLETRYPRQSASFRSYKKGEVNVMEEVIEGGKRTVFNYQVRDETDRQGNWVKRLIFLNGVLQREVIREITYF
ncbi:MAG TPA: hypothetical protein VGE26_07160 [Sphingobacteriaceae bacterium]